MTISQKAVNSIIFFEVGSPANYNKLYNKPKVEIGDSGITIGIGYDLGYNSKEQIQADWGDVLSADSVTLLKSVSGLKGLHAQHSYNLVKNVVVPYDAAMKVFIERSLKRFSIITISAYPGVDKLLPDASGALLSLVYNRGANTDPSNDRRIEMHNIKDLVIKKDYNGIADQLSAMKRLWGDNAKGLKIRRDMEADLVRHAIREYKQEELINI